MATTTLVSDRTPDTAVEEFLHPANDQTCLLLVSNNPAIVESVVDRLLAFHGWPHISLGRDLSAALLQIPPRQRARAVLPWLTSRLAPLPPGPVLCDRIDLLFEPTLELDPLTLLKRASRAARLVVGWPGSYADDVLTYAVPEHQHHRTWRRPDAPVVALQ